MCIVASLGKRKMTSGKRDTTILIMTAIFNFRVQLNFINTAMSSNFNTVPTFLDKNTKTLKLILRSPWKQQNLFHIVIKVVFYYLSHWGFSNIWLSQLLLSDIVTFVPGIGCIVILHIYLVLIFIFIFHLHTFVNPHVNVTYQETSTLSGLQTPTDFLNQTLNQQTLNL